MLATEDGGILLSGRTFEYGGGDPVIIKLNSCIEMDWCHIFHSYDNSDYANIDPIQTTEGEYIVHLRYYDQLSQVANRVRLVKLSKGGEIIWNNDYGLNFNLQNHDIRQMIYTSDGCFLLAGSCYLPHPNNPQIYVHRALIIKVDSNGDELWIASPGHQTINPYFGSGGDVIELSLEEYLLTGYSFIYPNAELRYCFFCLYKNDGEYIGSNTILSDSTKCNILSALNIGDDFLVSAAFGQGYTESITVILKTNYQGDIFNSFQFEHFLYGDLLEVCENRYLVSGSPYIEGDMDMYATILDTNLNQVQYSNSLFIYDSLCQYPIQTGTVFTDCKIIVNEPEVTEFNYSVNVYPNPAKSWVAITYEDNKSHEFSFFLYDSNGQEKIVISNEIMYSKFYIQRGLLPDGIYFYKLILDQKDIFDGKIIFQ